MTRLALVLALVVAAPQAYAQDATPAEPAEPADPMFPEDPDRISGLDDTSVGIIPTGVMAPLAVIEGKGIKIGEGTALYPTVGLDTGFVSNVFYEQTDTTGAGIIRFLAGIGTGSLSSQRLAPRGDGPANPGMVHHRAELRLSYDFYLSGNDFVNEQDGLGVAATIRGTFGPQRTWSFLYLDTFERVVRATNFESSGQVTRDINRLMLGVQFAPRGRSMRGLLHYTNTIDLFEDASQRFANRMHNTLGITGAWRFRPVTVLFATVSQGINLGLGSASMHALPKSDSYPLSISTGIQTLLTLKTSLIGRIGYNNGFYSAGPSYGTVLGGIELGFRYSPLGRVAAMYEYRHEDSINANFYRDHRARLRLDQLFVPFAVSVSPELLVRRYEGVMTLIPAAPPTRDDFILSVTSAIRYNFRDSLASVLQYRFAMVDTDFRLTLDGDTDDPSYARHELIVGVRAAL